MIPENCEGLRWLAGKRHRSPPRAKETVLGLQALGERGDRQRPRLGHLYHRPCATGRDARQRSVAPLAWLAMANQIDLAGRTAVVTGGAQGIGRAIAARLLDSGAAVAIWDRDAARAASTADQLRRDRRVEALAVDVTALPEIERARDATVKAFGRIDILINNAGLS